MPPRATINKQVETIKSGAKYQAVKNHIQKNKMVYAVGGTVVVTSWVTFLVTRHIGVVTVSVAPVINNNNNPIFNNSVNLGGHMTKMVKRLSDGKMWETVTEAANEAGVSLSFMSRHLNGHEPDVYNEIYKIVGIGTTG